MFQKKSLYYALPAILLSTLLVAAIIWAWTEPGQAPPGGNVPAPINVGGDPQTKSGNLGVGGLFRAMGSVSVFDGNVGIGTTEPGAKLHLQQGDFLFKADADDPGDIIFQNSTGAQKARIWSNPGAGAGLYLSSGDNTADITIDGSGNVGIGTTAPNAKLNVQGGTDVALSGGGFIVTGDLSGTNIGIDNNEIMARNNGAASPLYIQHEGGNTLLNYGGGNVGIGTTNPGYKLDVAGDINVPVTGFLRIGGSSGSSGQVLTRTDTGMAWQTPSGGGGSMLLSPVYVPPSCTDRDITNATCSVTCPPEYPVRLSCGTYGCSTSNETRAHGVYPYGKNKCVCSVWGPDGIEVAVSCYAVCATTTAP